MITPAHTVAKFIIQNSHRISNLKLQKLLYYVQGWHLGINATPVFGDELQAWVHGPVVPHVFSLYKQHRWNPIDKPAETITLEPGIREHTLEVIEAYGMLSAVQLERLSHMEEPWLAARKDIPADMPSRAIISHESMREYFSALSA